MADQDQERFREAQAKLDVKEDLASVPDTSFEAIRKRLGTKPGTLADFEAEYDPARAPDGDGSCAGDLRRSRRPPLPCLTMEPTQPVSKPSRDAAAIAEAVRVNRLREDAQRPISVNLAETIALSHALLKMADAAQRR